jgi:hypothetical protein
MLTGVLRPEGPSLHLGHHDHRVVRRHAHDSGVDPLPGEGRLVRPADAERPAPGRCLIIDLPFASMHCSRVHQDCLKPTTGIATPNQPPGLAKTRHQDRNKPTTSTPQSDHQDHQEPITWTTKTQHHGDRPYVLGGWFVMVLVVCFC